MTNSILSLQKHSELAHAVRKKPINHLTKEEHEFVSIDSIIFPSLYNPGFKPFPRYDLKLDRQRIMTILGAPKLLQLAMGYLETDIELKAHYLVNKYYGGIDEVNVINNSESKMTDVENNDYSEEKIPAIHNYMNCIGNILHQVNDLKTFGSSSENYCRFDIFCTKLNDILDEKRDDSKVYLEFEDMEQLVEYDGNYGAINPLIRVHDTIPIYESSSCVISANQKRRHLFTLEDNDTRKRPSTMTVCIVFHGDFIGEDYRPVKLSASLNRLNENGSISILGVAPYDLQTVNTHKKLGRIVINFDFERNIKTSFESIEFDLCIKGYEVCHYSVDVHCTASYHAHDLLVHNVWTYLDRRKAIAMHEVNATNASLDYRIETMKGCLLHELIEEAEACIVQYEKEIDLLETELHLHNDSNYDQNNIMDKIKNAELEFARQCRLISLRRQSIIDAEDNTLQYRKDQQNENDTVLQLKLKNKLVFESLSEGFHALFGNNFIESEILSMLPIKISIAKDTSSFQHRSRVLLLESDRICSEMKKYVASSMFHDMPQLFPKSIIQDKIQTEMRKVLLEQIQHVEACHPLMNLDLVDKDDDSIGTFDSETSYSLEEYCQECDDENDGDCIAICKACGTFPCGWKDTSDSDLLRTQRDELTLKIMSAKRQRLSRTSECGAETRSFTDIDEDIKTLTMESVNIDEKLKLSSVDKELHDSLQSDDKYFIMRSLHGYDTLTQRTEAIIALTAERDRLVGIIVSKEIVGDILDRMLNGWYFGIPKCSDENDTNMTTKITTSKTHSVEQINQSAHKRAHYNFLTEHNNRFKHQLETSEKSIKLGFAIVVLRYFRVLKAIRNERVRRLNEIDENVIKTKTKERNASAERIQMLKESDNFVRRQEMALFANEKAKHGAEKILSRRIKVEKEKIRQKNADQLKITLRRSCAIMIQRHFRGHIGRKATKRWRDLKQSVQAYNSLCHGAAIMISRVFRGYIARKHAATLRHNLATYIISLRELEIIEEEEQYWGNLRFGEWRRKRVCNKGDIE